MIADLTRLLEGLNDYLRDNPKSVLRKKLLSLHEETAIALDAVCDESKRS